MIDSSLNLETAAMSPWSTLAGKWVVVDMSSPYVYLGRLVGEASGFIVLEEADCHDLRDTTTTRERYVLDCRVHGIRANRHRVWVRMGEIVGISRLEDVVTA
jgi:hypothetical protein